MASCVVSGIFTDPQGNAVSGATIRVNLDSPVFDASGNLLMPKEVTTTTATNGSWSISLIQSVSCVLTLDLTPTTNSPIVKYKFSMVTPAATTATFAACWVENPAFAGYTTSSPLTFSAISGTLLPTQLPATGLITSINADSTAAQTITGAPTPGLSASTAAGTTTITQQVANTTQNGYLASADWNTFNGKQAALGPIVTPGTNPKVTYNAQGLVTAGTTLSSGDIPNNAANTSGSSGSCTGNSATVTTNANLSGPITSSGNTTAVAAQTGTGSTFVMQASPTLVTPLLGTPTSGVLTNCTGTASGLTAGTATNIAGGAGGSIPYQSSANTTALLANGSAGTFLKSQGTTLAPVWANPTIALTAPTVQKFTSGTGTYTTPTNPSPLYIKVTMVGGGGGGGPGIGTTSAGGSGGNSTFGTSLLVANGGSGGSFAAAGGTGGTASLGSGPIGLALTGSAGSATSGNVGNGGGGNGASGLNGAGSGAGGYGATSPGSAAAANTGAGGGGAGQNSGQGGSGGGSGGQIFATITGPTSTYSYAVGAAGAAGTGTVAGGAGGSGNIIVEEFYQ